MGGSDRIDYIKVQRAHCGVMEIFNISVMVWLYDSIYICKNSSSCTTKECEFYCI